MTNVRAYRVFGLLLVLTACGADDPTTLSREQLLDPETCKTCHPTHYKQWAASMHAYAADDPVFLAMNQRGQREAKLGEFCVNCHAPMAVREGATRDGLNLAQLPQRLKGVTCYFCHNATGIGQPHNNSLTLANDTVMRGPLADALRPNAHGVAYSRYHDRNALESSAMCGACHDIVTPNGVHLERTFEEYHNSIYPAAFGQPGRGFDGCTSCHMDSQAHVVAADYPGVPTRTIHEHLFPAVDVPLTQIPTAPVMREAVENCALPASLLVSDALFTANAGAVGTYTVTLETLAGHAQPSGSSQDRRMWLELTAYDANGRVTVTSGAVPDNAENFAELASGPNPVWTFHDRIFDAQGNEAHMFWDAASSAKNDKGYEVHALPVAQPSFPSHVAQRDFVLGSPPPAKVELRVRVRPIGLDVLGDLVKTGDLDPAFVQAMPTFTLFSATVQWKSAREDDFTVTRTTPSSCARYKCLLRATPGEDCSKL